MSYGTPIVKIRGVLVEIEGDDEVITDDNFEDSRMELRAAGHNLVLNSFYFTFHIAL